MNYRKQNIQDQLDKQGIVLADLQKAKRVCEICREDTLLVLGDGAFGRTQYICSNQYCNCQYSLQ